MESREVDTEAIDIDFDSEPREFARILTRTFRVRMEELANNFYDDAYFEAAGSREELIQAEAMTNAWRELFLGTFNPVRVHHLVYENGDPYYRDRDIMIGLVKQIADEVKHAKIWSHIATQFEVEETDLTTWTPPHYDKLVAQCRAAVEFDKPQYVVCGLQCSTEIFPALKDTRIAEFIEPEYPAIADIIRRDIVKDEGDHVHIGRKVIERFATPDDYEIMLDIANNKYDAVVASLEGQRA